MAEYDKTTLEELMRELSFDDLQEKVDQLLGQQSFDFGAYVSDVITGRRSDTLLEVVQHLTGLAVQAVLEDKKLLVSLFAIAVLGGIFTNLSKIFQGRQVADTARFVIAILYVTLLSSSFFQLSALAVRTLSHLVGFMKVFVPVFAISLSFTQGGGSAGIYAESALMLMTMVDQFLLSVILLAVNVYFFLRMADQLSGEEIFSKMSELLHDLIHMTVKLLFGFLMGMNIIRGMIVPVTSRVERMSLTKLGEAIPGVGNTVGAVLQSVLCAGTLIKNAVGVAGMVVVFLACAVPILSLLLHQFFYQLIAAAIQPISDSSLVKGVGGMADALKLLVYTVSAGGMIFAVFIALISAFTTMGG